MFDIIYRYLTKLMTQSQQFFYKFPYDYDAASRYTFKESVTIQNKYFWTMCKIKYNGCFLFFHKKTNLVFDDKMNLLGRYINNELIVIEDISNGENIKHWMEECRTKPLIIEQENVLQNDIENLFEIV